MGLVCRRLISRAVCRVLRERTAELLAPIQLGLGVRSGAKAAVHGVRRVLLSGGIVKLDFKNAFNCVHCYQIIKSVATQFPEIESYVRNVYGHK